jgi:hypothetical protein
VTAAPAPAGGPAAALPAPWPALLAGRRGRLLLGLLLTELVVAVQILVVVTVLPEVVRQLGGIRLYGLALSAAALAGIGAAPLAARLLGRYGARVLVPAAALLFGAGALGAGLAGQMVTLVAARLVEGAGAAALGTVAISGVATLYDGADRPRVMVLGNLAWMLPAVAGPAVGSLAVATVGWRWAFTAQLPVLVAAMVLIAPGLGLLRPAARPPGRSLTGPSLALLAGLVTVATLSWTLGGLVQARLSRRGWAPARLMAAGAAAIGTGIGGTALGLLPGAWLAPYLAWAVGGFGMGLAYTGVWLAIMRAQEDADGLAGAAGGLAGPLVADRLGTALGAGVGGVCIALATRAGLAVGTGIGLGLVFAAASAGTVAAAARRA